MESKNVNIGIKKIKDIEFFVNEAVTLTDPFEANINFELTTNVHLEEKAVEMLLTASFAEKDKGELFMKIKTSNVFFILELSDFVDKEKEAFLIPDNVMVTLFSLSVSHTRALLAKNALGTKFSEIYLPIINPAEMLKNLLGQFFSTNGK